jgi:O-succinylbenzoate synthase
VIRAIAVRPYRVEWAEPTGDARRRFREREGLIVELEDAEGRVGRGEAAPLPGRAEESFSDCREALESLPLEALQSDFRSAGSLLSPSLSAARHAVESALLELEALRLGVPSWQVLARVIGREGPAVPLSAAALVDQQELPAALASAERAVELGFRTLKLKIGREPVERILSRVRALEAAFPGLTLRLDANRTLSREEAIALSRELVASPVEFLEEPSLDVGSSDIELPLALDESVADPAFDPSLAPAQILVLKPMLLGVARCLEIAASAGDLKLVISHCFDGPHAMATARALALALGPGRPADGLGGHAVLTAWSAPVPELLRGPVIEPWLEPGSGFALRSVE